MNNTMKRRMIAFVAAIAAVVSLSGCDDNYDETPPLAKDYLTKTSIYLNVQIQTKSHVCKYMTLFVLYLKYKKSQCV